ncbi:MAG: PAS domain-containing protein, partial [Limisphaerales bacterium]
MAGVVLVFRDVTEQRRAHEASVRLAAVIEHSGEVIVTKNLDGIIQTWNASGERLFGYRAEEIIGKSVTILFPPERLKEEDHILGNLRQGKTVERLETIRVAKDGRRIPVAVSVSPLRNSEGELTGASKVIHDITDLVAAREALIREKELLATTLASIGDAVVVTDAYGHVTFLNEEAERLTQWKAADATGRSLPEVFHIVNEQTRQAVENPVEKVLRLGSVVGLANHTVLIRRDGSELPIDDSGAPIRVADGPLFGVVLVFRDFTERKRLEQTLRENAERAAAELQTTTCLYEVGNRCASPNLGYEECLNSILEAAISITGAEKGNVQLFDAESDVLKIAAHRGFDEPFLKFFKRVSLTEASACAA